MFTRMSLLVAGLVAATALGQTMSLVGNNGTDPPADPDDGFSRVTHFTYDLRGSTFGSDWTGSEISVDVVGNGRIWHATDQRIAEAPLDPADPNSPLCYVHDLNSPMLLNTASNRNLVRMWDTFFTGPGPAFTVDPQFALPPPPDPIPDQCPPPPIVSTPTRISGPSNPQGNELPLVWTDDVGLPLNNTTLARFTFNVNFGDGLSLERTPQYPNVFAVLAGRITSAANPFGTAFSATIYQTPEPNAGGLLLLIAAAASRRSARGSARSTHGRPSSLPG